MKYEIGEIIFADGDIEINKGKDPIEIIVNNTGDRTIQVCSHYHFFESNKALDFDREKAYGMRLDIPSGNAVRFEPGEEKRVALIPYGGDRIVTGFAGFTMGKLDDPEVKEKAMSNMKAVVYGGEK